MIFTFGSESITIGASGAIYGLLIAYAVTFPEHTIYLYFFIPIKAKYFAIIFGVFEFFASITHSGGPVAHLAHLGGMVIGFVYLRHNHIWIWLGKILRKILDRTQHRQKVKQERESENIRHDIDQILDKINSVGYDNLTKKERKTLDQASAYLRDREKYH